MPTERKRRRRATERALSTSAHPTASGSAARTCYTTKGVRKRRPVYGNSFDEVREKLDRLKGDSANGVLLPDRHILVRGLPELLAPGGRRRRSA